jgi:hypothetical protein
MALFLRGGVVNKGTIGFDSAIFFMREMRSEQREAGGNGTTDEHR